MARPARRPGNLPAETDSFVGRRRELVEVRTRLTEARLVSLVGPGGVGKTRLALRAATDLGRGFRGGGWLVELAEIGEEALVGQAVMTAIGLRDQAAAEPLDLLLAYLADQELLLVVDNCEHLLTAAAQVVTEVMRTAPGVRVIATSREPLSVPGEHVVPVPPLELPAPADRREPRGATPASDAADHHRVESRPVAWPRARRAPAAVRVRRPVHPPGSSWPRPARPKPRRWRAPSITGRGARGPRWRAATGSPSGSDGRTWRSTTCGRSFSGA